MIVLNTVVVHGSILFVLTKVDKIQSIRFPLSIKWRANLCTPLTIYLPFLEVKCDLNLSGIFCFIKVTKIKSVFFKSYFRIRENPKSILFQVVSPLKVKVNKSQSCTMVNLGCLV